MSVATELKHARETAGLSLDELARRTKIQRAKLQALEENAFERLPEGIYLDGIVRAYAREVGLDGNALLARLYAKQVEPVAIAPSPVDVEISPPALDDETLIVHDPPPLPAPRQFPIPPARRRDRPRTRWTVPGLALLASFGFGVFLSDRSESRNGDDATEVVIAPAERGAEVSRSTAALSEQALAPETVRGVGAPGDPAAAHHQDLEPPRPSPPARAITDTDRRVVTAPPGAPDRAESYSSYSSGTSTAPEATERPEAAEVRESPAPAEARDAPAAVLSGTWILATQVESSNLAEFEGLQLGYRLQLEQHGNRVIGTGLKVSENGRTLAGRARTPLRVQGTIDGDRLELNFTEHGTARTSRGRFVMIVEDNDRLRGRFSSTAAQSSGVVQARRDEG